MIDYDPFHDTHYNNMGSNPKVNADKAPSLCTGQPGLCFSCGRVHEFEAIEELQDPEYVRATKPNFLPKMTSTIANIKVQVFRAGPYEITEFNNGAQVYADIAYLDPTGASVSGIKFRVK
jgi:hypothetical protein